MEEVYNQYTDGLNDAPMLRKFDGKQMRTKTMVRTCIDNQSSICNWVHGRIFQRDHRDRRAMQPDKLYNLLSLPPTAFPDNPISSVCTHLVRYVFNKDRYPITCIKWTPEGKRLVTGSTDGHITLWNGTFFNFETIQHAHDSGIRTMEWDHNGQWMITADDQGFVKFWQNNFKCLKTQKTHEVAVRSLTFSPTDRKFASGSDDNTIKTWDFETGKEDCVFVGHGSEVRCVDWNPQLQIIASGAKESQMPVKLWDARTGKCLETIFAHKHPVMDVKWHKDANLLLTASRDHNLMLFDLRNKIEPLQIFRGHQKEVITIAWHPIHTDLFSSGGADGSINYWMVGNDKAVGSMSNAHDDMVYSLDWHPVGNIMASGSKDQTTKFWTSNKLGDQMKDKYNLNTSDEECDDDQKGEIEIDDIKPNETSSNFLIPGINLPSIDLMPAELNIKSQPSKLKRPRDESEDDQYKRKCPRYK